MIHTKTPNLSEPLSFSSGAIMKNRFMLAPLTNRQSHENGELSKEELNWLSMRAKGQFGLVMTCASHVQENGKGFPGQLGIFSDVLIEGHKQLSKSIQKHGSLAVIQLHHAGMRSPEDLIEGTPVCPSENKKHHARALSLKEVEELRDDFIAAAVRSKLCGYDGVEIHGAHGYILGQFLSKEINQRKDRYGGNLENRARLIREIIQGIRKSCGSEFLLGLRLSPEKFGMEVLDIQQFCKELISENQLDFLDISLWDCFKLPEDKTLQDKSLLEYFTELDYKSTKLTVAGKINTAEDVSAILESKVDFVTIGKSGILHHDFPLKVMEDPNFVPVETPVSPDYLKKEGLSDTFIKYMNRWPNFVKQ